MRRSKQRGLALLTLGLALCSTTPSVGSAAAAQTRWTGRMIVASGLETRWSAGGERGTAAYSTSNVGCYDVDASGLCTDGVWPRLPQGSWIWLPPDRPDVRATFLARFELPPHATEIRGQLTIAADNAYRTRLNGAPAGRRGTFSAEGPDESTWASFAEHEVQPRPGLNVLAVDVINYFGRTSFDNPAGVAYRLDVTYACGGHDCLPRDP